MPQKQIVINLYDTGEVDINAPLSNKILCLGMLAVAEHMVHEFKPPQGAGIVVAPPGVSNLVRQKGA